MTSKPKTTTRPVTRKVSGRKPTMKLARVTYWEVTEHLSVQAVNPFRFRYEKVSKTKRKRFTVRGVHIPCSGLPNAFYGGISGYAIWDNRRNGWLYQTGNPFWPGKTIPAHAGYSSTLPRTTYRTRAAAKHYLETTTTEDREYQAGAAESCV
jgi:hypothetical protein